MSRCHKLVSFDEWKHPNIVRLLFDYNHTVTKFYFRIEINGPERQLQHMRMQTVGHYTTLQRQLSMVKC